MNRKGPWEGYRLPFFARTFPTREERLGTRQLQPVIHPNIREFKAVLDSEFLAVDSGFPGAGFQSLSWELGFWITILSEIPDSLRCIPDSKARDSGFQEQTFPRFGNPDSLTWGDVMERLHYGMHALECSHVACLKRDSMYSCCMCSCSRTT